MQLNLAGKTPSHRSQGHVKVKIDSLLSMVKRYGAAVAEEYATFVNNHIYAIKQTVERESLDCEFELRRSYDVFLDVEEAEKVRKEFQASLKEGHSWTRERHIIDAEFAEQVS